LLVDHLPHFAPAGGHAAASVQNEVIVSGLFLGLNSVSGGGMDWVVHGFWMGLKRWKKREKFIEGYLNFTIA
jgi:hypothetical protein